MGHSQTFLGGCHDEQAWSSMPNNDDDSRLSSSKFPSRLSPLPTNHKRPLSAGGPGSEAALSPRQPPTRRLPKQPSRRAPPVPEFAKAFLRAWFNKNRKDPRLSDADKKALAQLTELPEWQIVQWVKIARAQSVTSLSDSTASSPFLPEHQSRCSPFGVQPSQLVGGAIPETDSGYFTPALHFSRRFGSHTGPTQHVAGLQSPFNTSPVEMQRYSLSSSSAGGSSTMFDNFSSGGSNHTSTTTSFTTDNGNGLHFVGLPQQSSNAYLTPTDDLNMAAQHAFHDTPSTISTITESPSAAIDRPYKCTYGCGGDSQNKSDWKRHEETHEPQKEYICLLNTPGWIATPDDPTTIECQFCTKRFPASSQPQMESHLSTTHLVARCLSTPLSHRTPFKRPDHLHQHLKTHHPSPRSTHWKTWNRPTATRKSGWGCGFCGAFLRSWAERVDHVGEHFKRGGVGFGEWDVGRVVAGLVGGVAGVRERWAALMKGEVEEGWAWDGRDTRVAALREKLENASSHDLDALALEARNLATLALTPNTNFLTTPTTTSSTSGLSPNSLRFINPFDFSPPSTPNTPYDGSSYHDLDDVLTYYKNNPYDATATTSGSHHNNNGGLHPIITTALPMSFMGPPQPLSASSVASSSSAFAPHDNEQMVAMTMAEGAYDINSNHHHHHRLSLLTSVEELGVAKREVVEMWGEIS
ncbi:MAG: hypothetical protein M1839_001751 [Geoglossum umbratile]|nr:MAG: hypothetical protein M1839_001751 [Geoglossum umbratile]